MNEFSGNKFGAKFARACSEWLHKTKGSRGLYFFMVDATAIRSLQKEGFTIRHKINIKDFLY